MLSILFQSVFGVAIALLLHRALLGIANLGMAVRLEGINKIFGSVQVLKDIDLVFARRRFVTRSLEGHK